MAKSTTFDDQTDILPEKQEMTTNIDIVIYIRKSVDESDTKHMDSADTLEFGHTHLYWSNSILALKLNLEPSGVFGS